MINACASAGISLPKTKSSYGMFEGHNPGDLGEDLREQNKNIREGKPADGNSATSKNNKKEDNDKKIGF